MDGPCHAADEFDAFYKNARTALLQQTFALTGDLPASRSAVRDAFVAAWHHWRKVSRLEDREAGCDRWRGATRSAATRPASSTATASSTPRSAPPSTRWPSCR